MIVRVASYPEGPRVWVVGQRCHHGASGILAAIALLAAKRRRLAILALLVVLHDRHDWRIWFVREGWPSVTNSTQEALDNELSAL